MLNLKRASSAVCLEGKRVGIDALSIYSVKTTGDASLACDRGAFCDRSILT